MSARRLIVYALVLAVLAVEHFRESSFGLNFYSGYVALEFPSWRGGLFQDAFNWRVVWMMYDGPTVRLGADAWAVFAVVVLLLAIDVWRLRRRRQRSQRDPDKGS